MADCPALARARAKRCWPESRASSAAHVASSSEKLELRCAAGRFSAIRFGATERLPPRVEAVYRLDVNSWQGIDSVQFAVEHWRPEGAADADWR
jgi:hypothetical protein